MSKFTLKSTKYVRNEFAGQTCSFPLLGNLTFDSNSLLVIETDDEKLDKFLELTKPSFAFDVYDYVEDDEENGNEGEEKNDQVKSTAKKPGRPRKEETEKDKELRETREMINIADTQMLLALVVETGDEEFAKKAATMTDEKIRKELLKRLDK